MTIETETMTTTASGKASEDKTKSFPKTTIRTTEQVVYVCVCLRSIHIVDIDPHPKPSSPQTILNCFVAENVYVTKDGSKNNLSETTNEPN